MEPARRPSPAELTPSRNHIFRIAGYLPVIGEIFMSQIAERDSAANSAWASRVVLPVMASAICLSAFLLFSVQPFFAKMVLPRLGGSPAVWSVAMVFFQSVLLAGYAYAHVLTTKLTLKSAALLHLAVLTIALATLPITISDTWSHPPESGQSIWLIGLFCASVGLPFFALSANSSLLQSWFSRTGHAQSSDPYFLYGASNVGSFASLILYVLLFEPIATLQQQNALWTIGFVVLILLIAMSVYLAVALNSDAGSDHEKIGAKSEIQAAASMAPAIAWRERLIWISYAFVPSALLVAVTAYVQTDVAAAPFLWILPLTLFLLTFVIVFQRKPVISHNLTQRVTPVLVIPLFYFTLNPLGLPLAAQILVHCVTFFAVALNCHGALAARRPGAGHLTEFYFCMSIGGVLGGIFSSLLAIHLFTWIAEYPLLLVLSLLTVRKVAGDQPAKLAIVAILTAIAVAGALALLDTFTFIHPLSNYGNLTVLNALLALSALYFLYRQARLVPIICAVIFLNSYIFFAYFYATTESRSFFGVLRVVDDAKSGVRNFKHGTTLHGAARIDDLKHDVGRPLPLTYYTEDGGINLAIKALRASLGGRILQAGIVGVGAGSLACQFEDNEALDLFEIDPEVVRIAKDPTLFPFLSRCAPGSKMIVGDGRIELEEVADRRYDILVIDAFSSDSIPVHLLTLEASNLYMQKLSDHGVLVIHISNKHLELRSVVGAIARDLGVDVRTAKIAPQNTPQTLGMATVSDVAVIAKEGVSLDLVLNDKRWTKPDPDATRAWTDGYSNLISALWRRYAN
jgi:uncharacterized protein YegJ (DUF2314 family)